jgi:sugar phosphate permease
MPLTNRSATVRKIAARLLPYLFLLYIVAFLDRVNVSFAGLDMTCDLNFSDRVFGLGAGIFFVGYVVFEIPGALLVERWSARPGRLSVQWKSWEGTSAVAKSNGSIWAAFTEMTPS